MSSIDERVVEMKFKDSSFQEGVERTLKGLKDLKDGLKLDGAAKGLEDIGEAADGIDLGNLQKNVVSINPLFAAMATVGVTALSRLTNAALDFGQNLVGSVLTPLFEGGKRRALNLEGARYSFRMLGIDATQAMNDANYAVEGTAYSLDVAAKAASQLSASQVALGDDMKAALRGISGVAALTNSSYEDISNVFTKVAGQGRLMGDDLNRLGSRGMNAAAVLAKSFGVTEEQLRKMVSEGKISFKAFAKAMDDAYGEQAVSAAETFSGALGQMNTALARIGADIEAPKLEALRRIYNALAPAINAVKFAIQPLLDMFGKMQEMKADGLVALIENITKVGFGDKADKKSPMVALQEGFKNVADSIMNVVKPIREAWSEVFPPSLGEMIAKFSFWFRDFTAAIKINEQAAKVIKDIFKGLFTVLKVGFDALSGVLGVVWNGLSLFFQLLGAIGGLFSPIIGYIYNLITGLDLFKGSMGKSTSAMDVFFNAIKWAQNFVLEPVIAVIKGLGSALEAFLNDGVTAKAAFSKAFTPVLEVAKKIGAAFGVAGDVIQEKFVATGARIKKIWDGVLNVFKKIYSFFKPVFDAIGQFISQVRDGIAQAFEGMDFNTLLAAVNTGVLLAFANTIRKGIQSLFDTGGTIGAFKDSLLGAIDGLTDTLGAMQQKLKADAILKIALAIGVLALGIGILSLIEPDRLVMAVGALVAAASLLMLAMDKFAAVASTKGMLKMPFIAYSLILLGTALVILSAAAKIFASMDWDELAKGLIGIAVGVGLLVGAAQIMSKLDKSIFKTAAAFIVLSVSLVILASAVAILGNMDWATLGKGLGAVVILLGLLVGAAAILSKNAGGMTAAAGGILAMAVAIGMLAGVVALLGLLPWELMLNGFMRLVALLGALTIVAKILSANAGGMTRAAGGLLAMAAAIGLLIVPILILSLIPWEGLIKGLGAIAALIVMLAFAATVMSGLQKGIAGIMAVSAAMLLIAVAVAIMAAIPTDALIVALLAVAAIVAILVVVAAVLGPLAPKLLLASAAIAVFALALLIIAAAMLVFAIAVGAMGASLIALTEGLKVFGAAAEQIWATIPLMLSLGLSLIVLGAGAAVAAIGIGLLGLALILLAAGLILVGLVGLIGATALTAVVLAVSNLVQYAGDLLIMGAALGVLGVGLAALAVAGLLAAAAVIALAIGFMIIVAAVYALGPALTSAAAGLAVFMPMVEKFKTEVPGMLALSVGIAAFGAAALAASVGIGLLGPALMSTGVGLKLVGMYGPMGAKGIKKVVEEVSALWGHAAKLAVISASLAALGASLLALGAGLGLTGAGAMLVVAALGAFVAVSGMFAVAINMVVFAIQNLVAQTGNIASANTALASLGTSIGKLGVHSAAAAAAIFAITVGFMGLTVASAAMGTAVMNAAKIVQVSSKTMGTSMKTLPPVFKSVVTDSLAAFNQLALGIAIATVKVQASARNLGVAVKNSVTSALNSAKSSAATSGAAVGRAITDGMTRGINNGSSSVSSAARRVAANALAAAKRELDSNSPSKKFIQLGEDSDRGLAMGFDSKAGLVADSASGVAKLALNTLRKSIADISKEVALDPAMRPTITPVLDLSLVKRDAPKIGSMFDNSGLNVESTYRDAHGISVETSGAQYADTTGNVTNINFNQTNNSPKALSDAEIYRQTKNQVTRLKKGVGASNVN